MNAGGDKHRAKIHAGNGEDVGIDDDDVAHGQEGGETCHDFRADRRAVFAQFKKNGPKKNVVVLPWFKNR